MVVMYRGLSKGTQGLSADSRTLISPHVRGG